MHYEGYVALGLLVPVWIGLGLVRRGRRAGRLIRWGGFVLAFLLGVALENGGIPLFVVGSDIVMRAIRTEERRHYLGLSLIVVGGTIAVFGLALINPDL
jgi:hypothetical protein